MITETELVEYLNTFGSNLRRHRNALKMSYDDLAELTGISKSILSRIENGANAPSFETFVRLHHALGVAADFFMSKASSDDVEQKLKGSFINSGFTFERKNFIGRPAVSAEVEEIDANKSTVLQIRRSWEENILIIAGSCKIKFQNGEFALLSAGEIYTMPTNRQSYEIHSEVGVKYIRISTPLSQAQDSLKRYIRVQRRIEK